MSKPGILIDAPNFRRQREASEKAMEDITKQAIKHWQDKGYKVTVVQDSIIVEGKDEQTI